MRKIHFDEHSATLFAERTLLYWRRFDRRRHWTDRNAVHGTDPKEPRVRLGTYAHQLANTIEHLFSTAMRPVATITSSNSLSLECTDYYDNVANTQGQFTSSENSLLLIIANLHRPTWLNATVGLCLVGRCKLAIIRSRLFSEDVNCPCVFATLS